MRNRLVLSGLLALALAGAWVGAVAQGGAGAAAGKRPMTFADLQRMRRVSDPQISPSGKWVMFSVVDVELAANTKTSHLWVVPMAGDREEGKGKREEGGERQITFWKEGESEGRFSPD